MALRFAPAQKRELFGYTKFQMDRTPKSECQVPGLINSCIDCIVSLDGKVRVQTGAKPNVSRKLERWLCSTIRTALSWSFGILPHCQVNGV